MAMILKLPFHTGKITLSVLTTRVGIFGMGIAVGWFLKGRFATVDGMFDVLALELATKWTTMDLNKDGKVDADEFALGVKESFHKLRLPAPPRAVTNKLYTAIQASVTSLKTLDTNGDGVVSASELALPIKATIASLRSEIGSFGHAIADIAEGK
eukprot:CAMPEP_0119491624 /NCGR_PEP_ID=MMETSP1344-20130328/16437_1 /TAXON_ID=236787 /ORGANISM="Florenciella parvula, Strain CCMP2471" /LENGTH=154 /DNA_ID=CAMNT_0007526885 /DNA_START=102 /DNA_END=566 /DNA_ORIENTATION=+